MIRDPLHELHAQAEAEFQPYGQAQIVSTFGNLPAEYAAIRKGLAVMDLPHRGLLEVSGPDRLSFLNGLLSNQVWDKATRSGLVAGGSVYAFVLQASGRIVADMNVLECGDRTLLDMDVALVEQVGAVLERYHFGEKVRIASRVGELHQVALYGPKSVDRSAGVDAWADDITGEPGCRLVLLIQSAQAVWLQLVQAGARPIGWAAFNAARIEAGRPLFGIDFDLTSLPAETGPLTFQRGVSLTKGCYIGQEIVARMHARGQLARQIVGLRMEDDALPLAGSLVQDEQGQVIGGITSSTLSPMLSRIAIALAMLKRPYIAAGTQVHVPAEGAVRRATVVDSPFLRR